MFEDTGVVSVIVIINLHNSVSNNYVLDMWVIYKDYMLNDKRYILRK